MGLKAWSFDVYFLLLFLLLLIRGEGKAGAGRGGSGHWMICSSEIRRDRYVCVGVCLWGGGGVARGEKKKAEGESRPTMTIYSFIIKEADSGKEKDKPKKV